MNPQTSAEHRMALVVEDSEPFARLVDEALASISGSWRTHRAATGAQARAFLRGGPMEPELVLVDLGLPDVSGVEVVAVARDRYPQVPIMVISVLTSSANVLAAIQAGACGYLHKGDSALSLSLAIGRVLAGEYPISPSLAHYLFKLVKTREPLVGSAGAAALAPRELELLQWLGKGHTYQEAARKMDISVSTAQTFSKRIYQKLAVTSKGEALDAARSRGWL